MAASISTTLSRSKAVSVMSRQTENVDIFLDGHWESTQ